MTVSIWRYSHWILAILTSLFVLIASVTGIILAVEPISNQLNPYTISGTTDLSIADLATSLNNQFEEVVSVEVDDQDFVKASVVTTEGKSEIVYINPNNAKPVDLQIKRAPIYKFATNLHRSLFLKSTGRFIIGLVSFLMILIVVTGIILIAKRQGGFKRWFSKVIKEDFNQFYHVVIGRYALVPILIITITGVILSMDRFAILPDSKQEINFFKPNKELKLLDTYEFELFKRHQLHDLVSLEYPFSEDEEDYFILKLKSAEYHINQYTGQVLMAGQEPILKQVLYWSNVLHTGQGTVVWALILLISCVAILFFMFSGLSMGFRRIKGTKKFKNRYHKDEAEYIVLVGTESGSTLRFATSFIEALISKGVSVFLDSMNNYGSYKKAKQILIFASTYGDGDAPAGAANFEQRLHSIKQNQLIKYAVLGFGSRNYPEFCKYAIDTDTLLNAKSSFQQILPVFKINNQSMNDYKDWVERWNLQSGFDLKINEAAIVDVPKNLKSFKVVNKTQVNADDTFIIQLKAPKSVEFQSGDLLAVYPPADRVERLYSIGNVNGLITLSIKKHQFGVASNLLSQLQVGDRLKAKIKFNPDFHLPTKTGQLLMISNGTGIAPFLGMICENDSGRSFNLLWGGRQQGSLELYEPFLRIENLSSLKLAFSREGESTYVQDLILPNHQLVTDVLVSGGCILICGSIQMQNGVLEALELLCLTHLKDSLELYLNNGQIKMDCY